MNVETTSRIIEMAWEDRTPFEAIEATFGLDEAAVIKLMRRNLKRSSFRLWRARVSGRKTKHRALEVKGRLQGLLSKPIQNGLTSRDNSARPLDSFSIQRRPAIGRVGDG